MQAQQNITTLVIGKDLDILASGTAVTSANLSVGQIAAREVGSATAFTGIATGKKFQLVYKKTDGNLIETPVIDFSQIRTRNVTDYAAMTQRIRYIGYDGTDGSIDATSNEDYLASISLRFRKKVLARTEEYKFAEYTSGSSTNQQLIAAGLITSFINNFRFESEQYVRFARLCNHAGTAVGSGFGTLTVVQGSRTAVAGDVDGGTTTPSVGDVLRVGGATTASPVYVVTAVDTANNLVTFDVPYQGADATVANGNVEYITNAQGIAANWGIQITAQTLPVQDGLFFIDQVDFDVQLRTGFGDTQIQDGATPSLGSGTYQQVSYLEYFLNRNRGEAYRTRSYPLTENYQTDSTKNYDLITVDYTNEQVGHINKTYRPQTLMVALEDQSSGNIRASLVTLFNIT